MEWLKSSVIGERPTYREIYKLVLRLDKKNKFNYKIITGIL